jgi:hypothetical protein
LDKDSKSGLAKPPQHPLRKTVGFNSGENRWQKSDSLKDTVHEQMDKVPGPGQYQVPTVVDMIQKKTWGKNGVFGSTERRFV